MNSTLCQLDFASGRHPLTKPAISQGEQLQITGLQARTIENLPIQHLPISASEFLVGLLASMPEGRDISGILADTAEIAISSDPRLAATLLSDFEILTGEQLRRLSAATAEPEGGIRRFYRGEEARWSDISENIIADITPYRNFRGRIDNELNKGFPGGTLFVLLSPAGMGKTVGLMSTAYWLRQQVNIPVLWFRSEGDLEQFFHRLHDNDFDNGAFIFVDDMAIYNADLDDIPLEILRKFCFIATSRETRWLRYGSRIKARFDRVIEEQIRQLNKNDATEIRDKIAQYGTLIYFKSGTRENQIAEVLEFSGRDLLVLIRELGQGLKFEAILQSEVDELSDEQRFCYFLICIADRVQVPLPRDLLRRAVLEEYPSVEFIDLVTGLGRLVRYSSGSTAVRSRHSVIAARVVEDPKRRDSALRRKAVEAYYKAFSHYQIPIIVHHSNTAHARVFKAVVYNRFLVQIFGNDEAIKIYHAYEKAFEKDAFYWQQFGLCYLRAKQHKLAVETLTHAATLHDNPLIKHSLGIAKLTTCFDLGPAGLGRLEFDQIRAEGKNELEVLHARNGAREDIAIVSLADLDIKIGRRFDPAEKSSEIEREYHTKLAFYLRSNPNMGGARRIYDQLHGALIGGSDYVGLSAEDVIESDI